MPESSEKTALVVCYSNLETDPRVTRQIDWLVSDGWTVDTLGLGNKPRPSVHRHFAMVAAPAFTRSKLAKGLIHTLLPYPLRFKVLVASQVPDELMTSAPEAGYNLMLVNDMDLLPWATKAAPVLLAQAPAGSCHLDVHEYHEWAATGSSSFITRLLMTGYHRWMVKFIGSPIFTSRSTVADGIADLYAQDFDIPRPAIVRNSPAFVDQKPSPVDPARIELVYHGNADLGRGLHLLVDAMGLLEEKFVLNLMLTGTAEGKAALREMANPLGRRVVFHDAVPMDTVAAAINRFDLEVIFYPPTGANYLYSFPNKFFEAVQGRLGVVIGETPSMQQIIEQYGNGLVVHGWTPHGLAAALNQLTVQQIEDYKRASSECARDLNSEAERTAFLRSIRPSGS